MIKKILLLSACSTVAIGTLNAGPYIGAGAGVSGTSENLNGGTNLATTLLAGYDFKILPLLSLGVEAQYNYVGKAIDTNGQSGGMYNIPLYATATVDLPLGLNLAAKLGYAYNRFNVNDSAIPSTLWRPAAAIQVGYDLFGFNLFFQSSRFFTDNRGSSSYVGSYTLGLMYKF